MSLSGQIRDWMAANPGKHFSGDVVEGVGGERLPIQHALCVMGRRGIIRMSGRRGSMRYDLVRTARKIEKRACNSEHAVQ